MQRVRLVTVSFDPVLDTPARMGELARSLGARDGWRFLTARDEAAPSSRSSRSVTRTCCEAWPMARLRPSTL
jgi:hypothetical protein